MFRNIEAWKKNIVTEKSEQSKETDERTTGEEKKDFLKFVRQIEIKLTLAFRKHQTF